MHCIEGENRGKVELYALSTCVWCRETKKLLNSMKVGYCYTDVDLLSEEEEDQVREKVRKFNPSYSFPTLIINDEYAILGFKKNQIIEALGK